MPHVCARRVAVGAKRRALTCLTRRVHSCGKNERSLSERQFRKDDHAVGNLLIDGQRPVAKSQSVQTILQQIPASQVVRIELLRGLEFRESAFVVLPRPSGIHSPAAGGAPGSFAGGGPSSSPLPSGASIGMIGRRSGCR